MNLRTSHWGMPLVLALAGAGGAASCGSNAATSAAQGTGGHHTASASGTGASGGAGNGTGGTLFASGSGPSGSGGQQQGFDVQPSAMQTLTVTAGQSPPTLTYVATYLGQPANAGWGLDKGNLGTIPPGPAAMATFTPSGLAGGLVTIQAGFNASTVQRKIMVQLVASQNGGDPANPAEQPQFAATPADLTNGGGIGGVGGEGLGGAVGDPATLAALGAPTGDGAAQGLKLLYPYDKTVWPRGLLAPILMWDWATGDADAIQLHLETTSGSFSYTGTFARPAILGSGGKFIRHPIPQDVWDMATNSAGGTDTLTVSLTVAKGGMAYGPISEAWTIAPGRLSGTIYYNSYGTRLAKNSGGAVGGDHLFGAAVLSIHVGDTAPKVVAGDGATCRTCHSVAAFGSRLIAMPYGAYSDYDLSPSGAVEHVMPNAGAWFPGLYPDGSRMLTGDGQLLPLPGGGAALPSAGLSTGAPDMPTFSPDGKLVAFNPGIGHQLVVQGFDAATNTFSGAATVFDDPNLTPGWPAFFPDGKSVVFEQESASAYDGHSNGLLWTRGGSKSQIAWTSTTDATTVTPLDQLNGKGYLPTHAPTSIACDADGHAVGGINPDHGDDVNVNYEPTVNPIPSGGYAWVVFTSRRMYGSVATIPPFCSDPRGVDLVSNITPKKLWVAAIDLTGAPGADASHPAFYLPAQEILAGNSRGFWVLDPCAPDGSACSTGDQCCNGFCEPSGDGGALTCSNMSPGGMCSQPMEKCATSADCCDPTNVCINGFCTVKGPQ
jgi:hypothetical protein